jgi:hypothetical protein
MQYFRMATVIDKNAPLKDVIIKAVREVFSGDLGRQDLPLLALPDRAMDDLFCSPQVNE